MRRFAVVLAAAFVAARSAPCGEVKDGRPSTPAPLIAPLALDAIGRFDPAQGSIIEVRPLLLLESALPSPSAAVSPAQAAQTAAARVHLIQKNASSPEGRQALSAVLEALAGDVRSERHLREALAPRAADGDSQAAQALKVLDRASFWLNGDPAAARIFLQEIGPLRAFFLGLDPQDPLAYPRLERLFDARIARPLLSASTIVEASAVATKRKSALMPLSPSSPRMYAAMKSHAIFEARKSRAISLESRPWAGKRAAAAVSRAWGNWRTKPQAPPEQARAPREANSHPYRVPAPIPSAYDLGKARGILLAATPAESLPEAVRTLRLLLDEPAQRRRIARDSDLRRAIDALSAWRNGSNFADRVELGRSAYALSRSLERVRPLEARLRRSAAVFSLLQRALNRALFIAERLFYVGVLTAMFAWATAFNLLPYAGAITCLLSLLTLIVAGAFAFIAERLEASARKRAEAVQSRRMARGEVGGGRLRVAVAEAGERVEAARAERPRMRIGEEAEPLEHEDSVAEPRRLPKTVP